MPRLPLEGIRCQATDESCKNHHCFFLFNFLQLLLFTVHSLICLMCCLCPLSGEYALAEYSEVKAVTIKLSETLWEELGKSSSLHFPFHQATSQFFTSHTLPSLSSVMLMKRLGLGQYVSWSIQYIRAQEESSIVHLLTWHTVGENRVLLNSFVNVSI